MGVNVYGSARTNPAFRALNRAEPMKSQRDHGSAAGGGWRNESGAVPYRLRRPGQVAAFFDGLELVDPDVVPLPRWRPDPGQAGPDVDSVGGVARKAAQAQSWAHGLAARASCGISIPVCYAP
jgi:hypothetical protein